MQGSAIVTPSTGSDENAPLKNDVYLVNGCKIKLSGMLSGAVPVARITPESYTVGHQVLTGDTQSGTPKNYTKFKVTPEGINKEWEIDSAGALIKKIKTVTINSSTSNPWKTLKQEVEKTTDGADIIIIDKDITASNSDKGEITVKRPVTIEATATHTLNASQKHRIFSVESGGNLTIKNIKLKNGKANGASGGIIYVSGGTVMLIDCTLQEGSARDGGGIALSSSGGTCTLENCTIKKCKADGVGHGGAVAVLGADTTTFTMKGSTKIDISINPNENDVYLVKNALITLDSTFAPTVTTAARITPKAYEENLVVLTGDNLSTNYTKFAVTSQTNPSQAWKVSNSGTLQMN